MEILDIKKPTLSEPLTFSYKVSDEDFARTQRRLRRADEIGLKLFILDDDTTDEELRNLEEYIIDNYIDMDIDVPEKLKER